MLSDAMLGDRLKCLPRSRGVPTSFYQLNVMFSIRGERPNTTLHVSKLMIAMKKVEKFMPKFVALSIQKLPN